MTHKTLCALAIISTLPVVCGEPSRLDSLQVLTGGYPRAFFFRSSEMAAAKPGVSYEAWEKAFERLMGIEGKVLDEEIPGRSLRNLEFFTRFKRTHPQQLVMLHYNGNARSPLDHIEKYFAGHWLYFNGARVLSDIPATAGEIDIRVSDPKLFQVDVGRFGTAKEDIGLCELDANGKPNWLASEQVKLVSIDAAKGIIRVKRGRYGTTPRAFANGRAYAAAHTSEGPWGGSEDNPLLWNYNHSTNCPRDREGRNCDDILAAEIAARFAPGGALATLDGLEFDVLKNVPRVKTSRGRAPDADADGQPDDGITAGVNTYGAGAVEFLQKLTAKMGTGHLVMADGWSPGDQRGFGLINGVESEGWPSLPDYKVSEWSGGLNRQLFWLQNSRSPAFTYVNHKFNIDGEKPGSGAPPIPSNIHRLAFSGAVFTDSAICFSLVPPGGKQELTGIWDELWMGAARKLGWLGQPLGPAIHLAAREPAILGMAGLAKRMEGEGVSVAADRIRIAAKDPNAAETIFRLAGLPVRGSDLLLTITAKAAPRKLGAPGRSIRVALAGSKERAATGWINQKEFQYTYYFPNVSGGKADIEFLVDGGEPIEISSLAAYAHPDVMYREFEYGVVLANPSPRPYAFDLGKLIPGRRFRRFNGTPDQDPLTNNGAAVTAPLTLGPKDAIFLALVP